MSRIIFTVSLDGDEWKIAAPAGSQVLNPDYRTTRNIRASIPGVLVILGVWELIEMARQERCGLRVLAHSPYGSHNHIACLWGDELPPLFPTP